MLKPITVRHMVLLGALAASVAPSRAAATLSDCASPLQDIRVESKIVSREMDALKKISTEFAQSYRFASSTFYYKEPNKLRVDSKAGLVTVRYVINGNSKVVKAGVINKRTDISRNPGQRQTPLTVGLVIPAWVSLLNADYQGERTINGTKTSVFQVHHKLEPKGSYFKLYMDAARKYVVRSETYHGNGRLKVTMDFQEPKSFGGVWAPTRAKVYNPQGELGAVTELTKIRVNTGLADSLFAL